MLTLWTKYCLTLRTLFCMVLQAAFAENLAKNVAKELKPTNFTYYCYHNPTVNFDWQLALNKLRPFLETKEMLDVFRCATLSYFWLKQFQNYFIPRVTTSKGVGLCRRKASMCVRYFSFVLFYSGLPGVVVCIDASLSDNQARYIRYSCTPNTKVLLRFFPVNCQLAVFTSPGSYLSFEARFGLT